MMSGRYLDEDDEDDDDLLESSIPGRARRKLTRREELDLWRAQKEKKKKATSGGSERTNGHGGRMRPGGVSGSSAVHTPKSKLSPPVYFIGGSRPQRRTTGTSPSSVISPSLSSPASNGKANGNGNGNAASSCPAPSTSTTATENTAASFGTGGSPRIRSGCVACGKVHSDYEKPWRANIKRGKRTANGTHLDSASQPLCILISSSSSSHQPFNCPPADNSPSATKKQRTNHAQQQKQQLLQPAGWQMGRADKISPTARRARNRRKSRASTSSTNPTLSPLSKSPSSPATPTKSLHFHPTKEALQQQPTAQSFHFSPHSPNNAHDAHAPQTPPALHNDNIHTQALSLTNHDTQIQLNGEGSHNNNSPSKHVPTPDHLHELNTDTDLHQKHQTKQICNATTPEDTPERDHHSQPQGHELGKRSTKNDARPAHVRNNPQNASHELQREAYNDNQKQQDKTVRQKADENGHGDRASAHTHDALTRKLTTSEMKVSDRVKPSAVGTTSPQRQQQKQPSRSSLNAQKCKLAGQQGQQTQSSKIPAQNIRGKGVMSERRSPAASTQPHGSAIFSPIQSTRKQDHRRNDQDGTTLGNTVGVVTEKPHQFKNTEQTGKKSAQKFLKENVPFRHPQPKDRPMRNNITNSGKASTAKNPRSTVNTHVANRQTTESKSFPASSTHSDAGQKSRVPTKHYPPTVLPPPQDQPMEPVKPPSLSLSFSKDGQYTGEPIVSPPFAAPASNLPTPRVETRFQGPVEGEEKEVRNPQTSNTYSFPPSQHYNKDVDEIDQLVSQLQSMNTETTAESVLSTAAASYSTKILQPHQIEVTTDNFLELDDLSLQSQSTTGSHMDVEGRLIQLNRKNEKMVDVLGKSFERTEALLKEIEKLKMKIAELDAENRKKDVSLSIATNLNQYLTTTTQHQYKDNDDDEEDVDANDETAASMHGHQTKTNDIDGTLFVAELGENLDMTQDHERFLASIIDEHLVPGNKSQRTEVSPTSNNTQSKTPMLA